MVFSCVSFCRFVARRVSYRQCMIFPYYVFPNKIYIYFFLLVLIGIDKNLIENLGNNNILIFLIHLLIFNILLLHSSRVFLFLYSTKQPLLLIHLRQNLCSSPRVNILQFTNPLTNLLCTSPPCTRTGTTILHCFLMSSPVFDFVVDLIE